MDFKEELNKYIKIVNTELEKYVETKECPEQVLNESKGYSLLAGGKRLRPILIIAAYSLFKNDIEKCYKHAVAIEMVHTFSLIHDDLPAIDNDDYRRGKLTNHKKFNEATAILAGDSLLNSAYQLLINDIGNTSDAQERNTKINALYELSYGIDRMIAGEYVDTEYEGKQISSDYLEYMHENKTGALIKAPVKIGAMLAGAPKEDIDKLEKYAEKIGLAFQIKDDIISDSRIETKYDTNDHLLLIDHDNIKRINNFTIKNYVVSLFKYGYGFNNEGNTISENILIPRNKTKNIIENMKI